MHLGSDRCRYPFSEWWRNGVSDLELYLSAATLKLVMVGKPLEALQFGHTQPTVVPMERADVWPRLALYRRRRPGRIEFQ